MNPSINLLRGAVAALLAVTAASGAAVFRPAPQAPETRPSSEAGVAAPVVLYLKVVDEGDPTLGMSQATYDRRRLEKHYVFEVRAASRPSSAGREYVVRCERARGVLTHPMNVRTEWDTDEPLDDASNPLDFSRKLSFSAPFGADLSVPIDGANLGEIGGLDLLRTYANQARKRAKAPRSPMSGKDPDPADLRAVLEPLFTVLPAPMAATGTERKPGETWRAPARLGVHEKDPPFGAELEYALTALEGDEARIEGSCAGDAAAGTPGVEFRATYSRRDGLPIAVDWKARLEGKGSGVGGGGRTVTGAVRRFSPALIDRWIADVRSMGNLQACADEASMLRGTGGDAAPRLFALATSGDDAALHALSLLRDCGRDAAPLLANLLRVAGDATVNAEVRAGALYVVTGIWTDVERRARGEAWEFEGAASQPASRPAADAARTVRDLALPTLADLLDADAAQVRAAASDVLGWFRRDARGYLPRLLAKLQSETDRDCLGAYASTAGRLDVDDAAFAPPLAKLLQEPGARADCAGDQASYALSVLGARAAGCVPQIVAALDLDRSLQLRNLLSALQEIGTSAKAALPRLRELRDDPQARQWVRPFVEAAIKAIEGE
jgi:hypothetical protein